MKARTFAQLVSHVNGLKSLYRDLTGKELNDYTGYELYIKLRRLERSASIETTAQCNGYYREPEPLDYKLGRAEGMLLRQDEEGNYIDSDKKIDKIILKVAALFGGKLPEGFHINYDARGYALKIKNDTNTGNPHRLHTDFGGYIILAPTF